jgi:hypothetical protein
MAVHVSNRRRNERFGRNCLLEDDNFGGGSVMMWGAISYALKLQLVHIPDNLNAARCGILPLLVQEPAAVLAEFGALVDDCARVDPNHPLNVLLGSILVI